MNRSKIEVTPSTVTPRSTQNYAYAVCVHDDRLMMNMSAAEARQLAIDLVSAAEAWDKAIAAHRQLDAFTGISDNLSARTA